MTPQEAQQIAKEAREAFCLRVIVAGVALREAQQKHQHDLQAAQDAFREKMKTLQSTVPTPGGI